MPKDFASQLRGARVGGKEKGHDDRLEQRLDHFRGYALASGKKYVDWDQAFMNAIRGDWAGLGPPVAQPRKR
jgi:hypothetical protein